MVHLPSGRATLGFTLSFVSLLVRGADVREQVVEARASLLLLKLIRRSDNAGRLHFTLQAAAGYSIRAS